MHNCLPYSVKMFRNLKLPAALFPLSLSKFFSFLAFCLRSVRNALKAIFEKFCLLKKKLRMNSKTRGFSLKFLTEFYLGWLSGRMHNSKTVCKI